MPPEATPEAQHADAGGTYEVMHNSTISGLQQRGEPLASRVEQALHGQNELLGREGGGAAGI
ncbi:hypothetical protein DRO32_00505 [Candidatus Bathyarchaeota archaeon]|nr:MAG: hypothetical protein DRO32_00505 [Candidatus Bathyarchaeota archaeon]